MSYPKNWKIEELTEDRSKLSVEPPFTYPRGKGFSTEFDPDSLSNGSFARAMYAAEKAQQQMMAGAFRKPRPKASFFPVVTRRGRFA